MNILITGAKGFVGKRIFSYNMDKNFFTKNFFQRKNKLLNKRNFSLEGRKEGRKEESPIYRTLIVI